MQNNRVSCSHLQESIHSLFQLRSVHNARFTRLTFADDCHLPGMLFPSRSQASGNLESLRCGAPSNTGVFPDCSLSAEDTLCLSQTNDNSARVLVEATQHIVVYCEARYSKRQRGTRRLDSPFRGRHEKNLLIAILWKAPSSVPKLQTGLDGTVERASGFVSSGHLMSRVTRCAAPHQTRGDTVSLCGWCTGRRNKGHFDLVFSW